MNTKNLFYTFSVLFAVCFISSTSAEVIALYEFDGAAGGASSTGNSGTGAAIGALSDNYGPLNGSGQLVVSADQGRVNTPMGSDAFSGNVFYRIDFNSWDTSGTNVHTRFGFRLRSGETDTTPTNKFFDAALTTGTGTFSANINTAASGSYDFVQGGMANPNSRGVSFILGVDSVADTFSIWWDNQLTGTYSILRDSIALNLGGETDFAQVNALTFDPGGGSFLIDRIALGNNFDEISTLPEPRTYGLIVGAIVLVAVMVQRRRIS